jgi:hypothetical protein
MGGRLSSLLRRARARVWPRLRPRTSSFATIESFDPGLERRSLAADRVLAERQRQAVRYTQLLGDEVDAGDHLGHTVLDLDA